MFGYEDNVRFSQVDEQERMTLPAIVDAMQDCSDRHSESIGAGREFLVKRHRAWLLAFWQIVIDRRPMEHEAYRVETRPWKFEKFFGQRNFALYDREGQPMVRANSVWFYVDTEDMRPVRCEGEDIVMYGQDEPLAMDYARIKKVRLPKTMEERESFPVRRAQIDLNHHVNNGKYIQMACEYFPEDWDIAEIHVEYRLAAKYGDRIYPKVGMAEDGAMIVALCQEDGTPYAVIAGWNRKAEEE